MYYLSIVHTITNIVSLKILSKGPTGIFVINIRNLILVNPNERLEFLTPKATDNATDQQNFL